MRSFSGPPVVRSYQGSAGLIELMEPLVYEDTDRRLVVRVPQGLVCDGASVPKWGWAWLSAGWVQLLPAGLLHDALYRTDFVISDLGNPNVPLSRGWADTVFVEAMELLGCSRSDRRKARAALWIGAAGSWRRRPINWRPSVTQLQKGD